MTCPATPENSTPSSSPTGLFSRLVRIDKPESPQLLTLLIAGPALVLTLVAVVVSCARWINSHGDLGGGAVTALGLSAASLAGLAGFAQRSSNGGGNA